MMLNKPKISYRVYYLTDLSLHTFLQAPLQPKSTTHPLFLLFLYCLFLIFPVVSILSFLNISCHQNRVGYKFLHMK